MAAVRPDLLWSLTRNEVFVDSERPARDNQNASLDVLNEHAAAVASRKLSVRIARSYCSPRSRRRWPNLVERGKLGKVAVALC